MMPRRAALTLRYELHLFLLATLGPFAGYWSKLCLAVGFGALFVPWDPMATHIVVFGYFDKLGFALSGLACGRLLVPHHVARQLADRYGLPARDRAGRLALAIGRVRSAALSGACVLKWRIARGVLRRRTAPAWPRTADPFDWLGYRWWWRLHAFAAPRMPPCNLIVLGGAERSGTTLLRTILGRHPQIASGPETTVFLKRISSPADIGQRLGWDPALIRTWQRQSRSQPAFIALVQSACLKQSGKTVWAEKTPGNVERFGFVRKHFPHAKLIHIVRDGRDVVCSLRHKPFAKIDRVQRDSAAAARRCAIIWRQKVLAGLRHRGCPAYYEMRYEDLVQKPEATLRPLMRFLGLPWDDRLLIPAPAEPDPFEAKAGDAIFTSSVGRWRQDLSNADTRAIAPLMAPLLVDLGYEPDFAWGSTENAGPWYRPLPVAGTLEKNAP